MFRQNSTEKSTNVAIVATTNDDSYHFLCAAFDGKIDVVRSYLEKGVDVNTRDIEGSTALHYAVQHKNAYLIDLLKSYKANCNVTNEAGFGPIHNAVKHFSRKIMATLICFDEINLDLQTIDGTTAAYLAAQNGNFFALMQLKTAGANLNLGRFNGCTPAMVAAFKGNLEILRIIASDHINLKEKTLFKNKSPLDVAKDQVHVECIKFINEVDEQHCQSQSCEDFIDSPLSNRRMSRSN